MAKNESTAVAEAPAEKKTRKRSGLSAIERLTAQLEEARVKAAEKAEGRIEKAKAEVTAAEKDYNRASTRLTAARTTLTELEAAAGHTAETTASNGATV